MIEPDRMRPGVSEAAHPDRLGDGEADDVSTRAGGAQPQGARAVLNMPVRDAMALLAHVPRGVALASGLACLGLVVLLDDLGRGAQVRLVPVYVPLLCVVCWALGRWLAVLFAVITAIVATVPDIMAASGAIDLPTIANGVIRATSYIFLAFIIVAYRRSYDEADLRAMYDGLTGVLNKMPFNAAVRRHVAEAQRMGRTLLIAFVDLDDFKSINTAHGHAAGDAALRAFSREALSAIRGSDAVGRLGGDEFGFALSAASEHDAQALAHVLHDRLMVTLSKTGLPLSCSMGGLIVPPHWMMPEEELISAADELMLQAKASGKSVVITNQIERLVRRA